MLDSLDRWKKRGKIVQLIWLKSIINFSQNILLSDTKINVSINFLSSDTFNTGAKDTPSSIIHPVWPVRKLTLGVFSFLLSNHWFAINAGNMYWSTSAFFSILRSTDLTMSLLPAFRLQLGAVNCWFRDLPLLVKSWPVYSMEGLISLLLSLRIVGSKTFQN